MPFPFLGRNDARRREQAALSLYTAVVHQSRQPVFYARLGVADTVEGRYDLLVLHAFLVLRRLGSGEVSAEAKALSQAVFDLMFADMDQNLREIGVTDTGVGKRIRKLAEAFYGRISAYDRALAEGDGAVAAAVARNLLPGSEPSAQGPRAIAAYLIRQEAHVAAQDLGKLLAGHVNFLSPEEALP